MTTIKVLAMDYIGGSSYHRIKLPYEYTNGKEIGEYKLKIDLFEGDRMLTEDVVKNYDIVWYNWNIKNDIHELNRWQHQYRVKFLYDIDDLPEYDPQHPYMGNPYAEQTSKDQVFRNGMFADLVTVTTVPLARYMAAINDDVRILPNFLPLGKGQFTPKKEYFQGDVLNVGIIGSISHYPDWLMLKGAINRIAKNKELCKKIKFWILGWEDTKHWQDIESMFKVKKSINYEKVGIKSVNDYMSLYDYIDVALCPLKPSAFTLCKSSLKLAEILAKKIVPVGTELFAYKEINSFIKVESPIDWEHALEALTMRENYDNILKDIVKNNTKLNQFEDRIEQTANILVDLYKKEVAPEKENLKIYQIIYADGQPVEHIQYDNSKPLEYKYRLEYNPMIDVINNLEKDYEGFIGVVSWKLASKTGLIKKILYGLFDKVVKADESVEVINISRPLPYDYMKFSEEQHPGLCELVKELCTRLGMKYHKHVTNVVYANQILAKADVYKKYINEVIIPSLEILEGELFVFAMKDSSYKSGISPEELQNNIGMNYYPMLPFVLERMWSQFLGNNNYKIVNLHGN